MLQVAPVSDVEYVQVRATFPVKPSFELTATLNTALLLTERDSLREFGSSVKCGSGVLFSASMKAVASTEPRPVTWS